MEGTERPTNRSAGWMKSSRVNNAIVRGELRDFESTASDGFFEWILPFMASSEGGEKLASNVFARDCSPSYGASSEND